MNFARLAVVWVVIPRLVKGNLSARETLCLEPAVLASGAHAARPERVPLRTATRNARPPILGARPPFAFRTVDLRLFHTRFIPGRSPALVSGCGSLRHKNESVRAPVR